MTQANDSFQATPGGSGPLIATHLVNGKEYQVVMAANMNGHIMGSLPSYTYFSPYTAGASNRIFMDIFNASGSGVVVKVRKIFIQPNLAATTVASVQWDIAQTATVGTGGTVLTGQKHDSTNPNIPAQVTARYGATGGASTAFTYFSQFFNPEETLPGIGFAPWHNVLPVDGDTVQDITLNEGQGLKVLHITNATYTWGVLAVVTIE